MRRTLIILIALAVCGCSKGRTTQSPTRRTVVERDARPAFVLDVSKPFVVEFGRGSGLSVLDITKVGDAGVAEIDRIILGQDIERASIHLSSAQIRTFVDLVNSQPLTSMGRSYSDPDIQDGTQWVLSIQQAPSEKSIYFNNAFPDAIKSFADRLDALLRIAGSDTATWTLVPLQQGIDRQKELWSKIEHAK